MSLSKLRILVIGIVLSISFTYGCIGQEPALDNQPITFEQLFSAPKKYHEKSILLDGFIFLGWETNVICEELRYSGYAEGHIVPGEKMLWIEGGIPPDIRDELAEQHMMGPSERYGKVLVKGIFQYGGQYGHLGAFEYQISPLEIELLAWSPN